MLLSCLQGAVITLPTKRPKRTPQAKFEAGGGNKGEKIWGERSNRRVEGEKERKKERKREGEKRRNKMIDRLGGFRREVRRWMEKENTGDDREAGLGESVAMVSIIILLQSAGRTGDGRTF